MIDWYFEKVKARKDQGRVGCSQIMYEITLMFELMRLKGREFWFLIRRGPFYSKLLLAIIDLIFFLICRGAIGNFQSS